MLLNATTVMYINLERRLDRKIQVIHELKKIGVEKPLRFKAIELENGALGCSMSHLKCIELAKKNNLDYVFIVEDDIEFLEPVLFLQQFQHFFTLNLVWDVILVAGNNMVPYVPVNDCCIKALNCQTTTGYIVKKAYYDTLIQNYKDGIQKLIRDPTNVAYKIDKYWFSLQQRDNWYLIIPLSVVQREDYSDIEKKVTNFKSYMLNYNKAYMPKKL